MGGVKRFLEDVSTFMGFGGEITPEVEEAAYNLKVYLDDLPAGSARRVPPGWVGVKTPEEAIALLNTSQVRLISLDYDLGLPEPRNGYAVLKWIKEQVHLNGFVPPKMWVHTASNVGRDRMLAAIKAIYTKAGMPLPLFNPVWVSDCPKEQYLPPDGNEA